jgi:hypothetical protein
MALQSNDLTVNERLQPGARGEQFQVDMPGHRNEGDRLNRTNTKMDSSEHDVLNTKYEFDYRLPTLFRYGFAYGFNQIVIPKGRIVAVDQHMDLVDFESQKQFNTLTLANGGAPVRLRKAEDKYRDDKKDKVSLVSDGKQGTAVLNAGKDWIPVVGMQDAYTKNAYRPFSKRVEAAGDTKASVTFASPSDQMVAAGMTLSDTTGKVIVGGQEVNNYRTGNVPLGMIERNEYTRDDDAFNGIMPGPVLTDALVVFPWFAYKDKAEQNPWGSAYGNIFPGALVKSDENGRVTVSPLSFPDEVATMGMAEYELERQQVIGQVYSVNHELVPEGAAKWATWALEDRLNSEEFNPAIYAKTNRHGEDAVNGSPFNSEGKYPGYPYDKNYLKHDLHMLASAGRKDDYDPRMNPEYQYSDLGIPGLTDGANAVVREIPMTRAGMIHYAGGKDYVKMFFRAIEVNMEEGSLQIQVGNEAATNCVKGAKIGATGLTVTYANPKQGLVVLEVLNADDKKAADTFLNTDAYKGGCEVKLGGKKRGQAGVPTFMDWDGICGSIQVLFQK